MELRPRVNRTEWRRGTQSDGRERLWIGRVVGGSSSSPIWVMGEVELSSWSSAGVEVKVEDEDDDEDEVSASVLVSVSPE